MRFANLTIRLPQLPITSPDAFGTLASIAFAYYIAFALTWRINMPAYHDSFEIPNALRPWVESEVARMQMWGEITRNQARALLAELTPLLPCNVKVGIRSPKSIIYVQAGAHRFRINQRARVVNQPWRIGKPRNRHVEGREWHD